MGIIWTIIVGFVVGLVARAVMPGTQSLGIILTTVLGVAGSLAASYIGQAVGWYRAGEGAGFIGAVVGAVLLLAIYSLVTRSRGGNG